MDFGLAGKRALVTGAGQGVGEGIALALAAAGAHVLVNDLVAERADAVVAAIAIAGGSAGSVPFDVTDHEGVHAAVVRSGPIDVLVNNAGNAGADGFGNIVPFVDTTPADWARFVDVNLFGVMNCAHATLPGMIASGWGRIVTIVSDAGRRGDANMAAYGAAKAGAAGFGRGIAREVARHGITVNNVSLGTMRTPLTAAFWDDPDQSARHDTILRDYLVRRPGDPEDVAWIVSMLVSSNAGWITGQTIPVNGGCSFAL